MTVVETTVWVDYLNKRSTPKTEWLDQQIDVIPIAMFDLVLCEVLQGMNDEREFREAQDELLNFAILSTGGAELALASAKNYQRLRRRGITVRKTVDCLIATACIAGGHRLLHNDRDYVPFEMFLGLNAIHP